MKRCLYCDFASTTRSDLIDAYFEKLFEDLKNFSKLLDDKTIRTVYFGGGTPSSVDAIYIGKILEKLNSFRFDPVEINIEANPESLSVEKVSDYTLMGINRLSLGVQAFDDTVLKLSGRPHGTKEVLKALELASRFEKVNIDFIVGLPGYDKRVVEKNLKLIEEFKPDHVSVYTLELHEETPLSKLVELGKITLPESTMELFHTMKDGLSDLDYERYEISNFAKNFSYSIHNLSYWYNLDYLGIGISAGGHHGNWRYVKTRKLEEYLENPGKLEYDHENSKCEEAKEKLFMGLRLIEGIEMVSDEERKIVESLEDLVEIDGNRVKLVDPDDPEAFVRVVDFECEIQ